MNQIRSCCLQSFSIFKLILFLLIFFISSKNAVNGQQQPVANSSLNSAYDPFVDIGYAAKLKSLLSSLSSNASAENASNSNELYLCRGDVNTTDCEACLQTAGNEILKEYSNDTSAILWYVNCLLRYSNQTPVPDIRLFVSNTQSSDEPDRLNNLVGSMINELATKVSSNVSSGTKFGVQESNFSAVENLYSLAQCIPGLSNTDCNTCLRDAMNMLPTYCNGSLGGRILSPSCNIRYETYRFYDAIAPPTNATNRGAHGVFTKPGKKLMSVPLRNLIISLIVVAVFLIVVAFVCLRRSMKRLSSKDAEENPIVESLNYSLSQVQNATNNFSEDCKIGQGGFGIVYKGTLPNGQEVAVKRLTKSSLQGLEDFKNEILLVAKLQHINLVRLLGFCFENQEMILIYEFLRNKSLDHFLFDPEKQRLLDWKTRHMIIREIAKGLLYLHEDSRLKIIHRDLKASNVLLDDNMNPKIADFGTARLLQLDQSEENTRRIAGTYGYMAPEYAVYGHISVKADVFSFGVLLLEIISGQKNYTFYQSNGVDDLRSYAWKNFMNGVPLALLDPSVGELYARKKEVIHCIHVGLLCVQGDPQSRPTMSSVVIMLGSNTITLPIPLQPAFFAAGRAGTGDVMQPEQPYSVSGRDASFTELYPR